MHLILILRQEIEIVSYLQYTLEKTEGAIKNGESRETGNSGYTRHKTKTNKTKNTTHYVLDTIIRVFVFVFHRLVYHMLSVSLDSPFLIATLVFSNVYFHVYTFTSDK
jgi:hypothetical protein